MFSWLKKKFFRAPSRLSSGSPPEEQPGRGELQQVRGTTLAKKASTVSPVKKMNKKKALQKQASPYRVLNSKLNFEEAEKFYWDLAPTSQQKLKKSLQVTHNNKPYISMKKLYVGPSALPPVAAHGGRGVFAGQKFEEGELVEICPLLLDRDEGWAPKNPDAKVLPAHEYYTIQWGPDWFALEEKGYTRSGKLRKDVKTSLGPWEPDEKAARKKTTAQGAGSRGSGCDENCPHKPRAEYRAPTSHLTFVSAGEAEKEDSDYHIKMSAIMLGYGSLYNHARQHANVEWQFGADATVEFVALRDIEEGEELLVDYGDEYWMSEGGSVPDA